LHLISVPKKLQLPFTRTCCLLETGFQRTFSVWQGFECELIA
jgi:hypothetical protein